MRLLVSIALALLVAQRAQAAEPATGDERLDPAIERAKRHNAIAKKLFSLGLFREAADEYEQAYRAWPTPAFLLNLAQCHKRVPEQRHLERAIFYFQSYLQNVPGTPLRRDLEKEIRALQHRLAELMRPPPIYKRWWFWTAVGVVVAGATVATVLALQPEDAEPIPGSLGEFTVSLRRW